MYCLHKQDSLRHCGAENRATRNEGLVRQGWPTRSKPWRINFDIRCLFWRLFYLWDFSITANATKPIKPIKDQTIKSAPLEGVFHECLAVNDTQENLVINMSFHNRGLTSVVQIELIPEETLHHHHRGASYQFCVVSWVGLPDDVRASYCTWEEDLKTGNKVCLELY